MEGFLCAQDTYMHMVTGDGLYSKSLPATQASGSHMTKIGSEYNGTGKEKAPFSYLYID